MEHKRSYFQLAIQFTNRIAGRVCLALARIVLSREARELANELARCTPVNPLPETLLRLLTLAEDKRFAQHLGIDLVAVARAVWHFVSMRKVSGASTIEQQLVRVITRRYERSLRRKIREMLLATTISAALSKEEVAAAYLHVAYFGASMNGLDAACRRLNLVLGDLSERGAADLVCRLKYPEPAFCSSARSKQITRRAEYLLERMQEEQGQRAVDVRNHETILGL
jgi:membrane carboxypeptidase/penicillin-binding protein